METGSSDVACGNIERGLLPRAAHSLEASTTSAVGKSLRDVENSPITIPLQRRAPASATTSTTRSNLMKSLAVAQTKSINVVQAMPRDLCDPLPCSSTDIRQRGADEPEATLAVDEDKTGLPKQFGGKRNVRETLDPQSVITSATENEERQKKRAQREKVMAYLRQADRSEETVSNPNYPRNWKAVAGEVERPPIKNTRSKKKHVTPKIQRALTKWQQKKEDDIFLASWLRVEYQRELSSDESEMDDFDSE